MSRKKPKKRKNQRKRKSRLRLAIYSQNVNSISCSKYQILSNYLKGKAAVLCLQELNLKDHNDISTVNPDGSSSEYDLIIPDDKSGLVNRVGFMIRRGLKYKIIKSISFTQEKRSNNQSDKRTAFISAIKVSNKTNNKHILIVNIYFTPDSTLDTIKKCCEYVSQFKYQKHVVIMGDSNIDCLKKSPKSIFYDCCKPLDQLVKKATRKAAWYSKSRKKNYSSSTLIDVCLSSPSITKDAELKIDDITLTILGKKTKIFDHSGLLLNAQLFDVPNSYSKIIVTNCLKRKCPTPETIKMINDKLNQTPAESIRSFEDISKIITDSIKDHCKLPTPIKLTITIRNDVEISKETKDLIAKKRLILNSKRTKETNIALRQIRRQVNHSVQVDRLKAINKAKYSWGNLVKSKGIWPVYNILKNGKIENQSDFDNSVNLKNFVNEASEYYDNKSKLVSDDEIVSAELELGDSIKYPNRIIQDHEINFMEIEISDFEKFFPARIVKVVDANGMTIQDHFYPFWANFVELYNKSLVGKPISKFPENEKLYFQKLIKKSVKKIKSTADCRPIGINHGITKYLLCSQFFSQMQDSLKDYIVSNLNNFSFHGCLPLVINLLDKANSYVAEGYKVALINYDISNAFGCNNRSVLLKVLEAVGFDKNTCDFVREFCENQNLVRTLAKDEDGSVYWSRTVIKGSSSGYPQGAIGSSILFAIFSFLLSFSISEKNLLPIDNRQHYFYVDDSSTVLKQKTSADLIQSIKTLNDRFHLIATYCGLKMNNSKSVVLPVNLEPESLSECGLPTVKSTKFLGVNISSAKNRMTCFGVEKQITSALSSLAPILTKILDVTKYIDVEERWLARRMIARNLILSQLYAAPVFVAYTAKDISRSENVLKKITVSINQAIRLLGLSCNTPSQVLWSIIGCKPSQFIINSLINIGRKMKDINSWEYDRSGKFRNLGYENTFEYFYKHLWNNLGNDKLRVEFMNDIDGCKLLKNYMKKNRDLPFELDDVVDFTKFTGRKSHEVLKRKL